MLKHLLIIFLLAAFVESACNVPKGINESSANFIVSAHNTLRSFMAKGVYLEKGANLPSASNMRKMSWSCDLQKQAQDVIDRQTGCDITDLAIRSAPGNLVASGSSNRYYATEQGAVFRGILTQCKQEMFNGGWQYLSSSQSRSRCEQLVWWDSNNIGCAYKHCGKDQSGDQEYAFICKYSPSGHIRGKAAYASGTPCSSCGNGFKCEAASKLCIPA